MDDIVKQRNNVEQKIVDTMLNELDSGNITRDEMSNIAAFVLDRVDNIFTQEELLNFLRELSAKWRIYSNLLVLESGEYKETVDAKAVRDALTLTKEGKIEDALNVAKAATSANI